MLVGGDGRVRVTDFGLARSVLGARRGRRAATPTIDRAAASTLTATGTVLGTPRYMPPEQLTGPDIDARSDQFSFCVALYEALYGAHPLPGATVGARCSSTASARCRRPRARGSRRRSARAVMRGLAKERAQRFPTMAALIASSRRRPQRAPVAVAAVAIVGVIVLGVATAAVMASHRPQMITADGPDSETIRVLVDQINILETQVKQDRKKLLERDLLHGTDVEADRARQRRAAREGDADPGAGRAGRRSSGSSKVLPKSTTQGSKRDRGGAVARSTISRAASTSGRRGR